MKRSTLLTLLACCALALAACPDDEEPEGGGSDSSSFRDASPRDLTGADSAGDGDLVADDALGGDADEEDAAADGEVTEDAVTDGVADTSAEDLDPDQSDVNPGCDVDHDSFLSEECGGNDCDDTLFSVQPGRAESCDFIDNNCDEVINEGITCEFYASSNDTLYLVDPFLGTATEVTDALAFWDIDTHPDGSLYGVNSNGLFRLNGTEWQAVGDQFEFTGRAEGMAIDLDGIAHVTAGTNLYTLSLTDGSMDLVGPFGGVFESSGDCVINKNNTLFMTSKHLGPTGDTLVVINVETGVATNIGNTGMPNIFGLTSGWGYLFGLSVSGDLITIDETTGESEIIHRFGHSWFGSASLPER